MGTELPSKGLDSCFLPHFSAFPVPSQMCFVLGNLPAPAKSLKTTKQNQITAAMNTFSQGADEV